MDPDKESGSFITVKQDGASRCALLLMRNHEMAPMTNTKQPK